MATELAHALFSKCPVGADPIVFVVDEALELAALEVEKTPKRIGGPITQIHADAIRALKSEP